MNILLVIMLLVILMTGASKLPLSAEASRKTVHVGMGLICLSFPWLFYAPWQVDLLAGLAVSTMLILRWKKPALGQVLHRIERLSFGELLFPVGIAIVFRLSNGDLSTYLPAIAILTFADSAGALIGKRFGRHPYRTNAGQKSLEGSLTVFLVSVLILLFSNLSSDPITAILIALVVALVVTMAEGVLGAGVDNLILPIAVYALIFLLRDQSWEQLIYRIVIILSIGLLLTSVRNFTSLNGGGLLSATTFAYLCFALGGIHYLIGPALLFAVHLITTKRYPNLVKMEHSADSICAVALPGLIWLTLGETTDLPETLCHRGFCLTLLAQAALLHSATRVHLTLPHGLFLGSLKICAVAAAGPFWWYLPFLIILLIVIIPLTGSLSRPAQTFFAFVFSFLALIP